MKVQLANTYNPSKNYKTASWYATPKFDGVRAVFIPHNGFFTRNEKPIAGFERMAEILDEVCMERGLLFVDGELVLKDRGFQASQSAILASEHADESKVEYHVFAAGGGFIDTADMLKNLPDMPAENIFRVNSELIPNTFEAVEAACGKFTAQGYEGVVLRDPLVAYVNDRTDFLLKYKFFREADLRITHAHEGAGKFAGTLGSLTVEGIIDGVNVRSNVGTGLTDEDRRILFADKNLTGKIITVKYQSLTSKPDSEGYYSLRFPAVIGLKEDRDFSQPEAVTEAPKFTGKSNCTFRKNGYVEISFQVKFVSKPMEKPSYLPTEEEMSEWKSKLFTCSSLEEGTQLIKDLRLTIPKITEFAKYLGVNLSGCQYLKAEIVKWLVLGAFAIKEEKCRNKKDDHGGSRSSMTSMTRVKFAKNFCSTRMSLRVLNVKHLKKFSGMSGSQWKY